MAADYLILSTTRSTPADLASALTQWRAQIAADVGYVQLDAKTFNLKKEGSWTDTQKATAQTVLDTAPTASPQLDAQHTLDDLPIWAKALALVIMDELNILRGQHALAPRTQAQLITAMKNKAATL